MKLSDMKKPEKQEAFVPPTFEVTTKKEAEKLEEAGKQIAPAKTKKLTMKEREESNKKLIEESKKEAQKVADVPIKNLTAPTEVAQTTGDIKLQRVEWFDDRYYFCQFPDGTSDRFPSSTHILGVVKNQYLVKWQMEVGAEEANRRLREAGDRGTRIHHACETLLKGGVIVFNPFNRPQYNAMEIAQIQDKYAEKGGVAIIEKQEEYWQIMKFREWAKIVDPGVISMETMLCSREHGYAGTLDYLLDIKGGTYNINGRTPVVLEDGIYIGDLKSSNSLHESYNLQIASYLMAYEEMFPEYAGKIKGCLIVHTNAQTKSGIEGLATVLRTREQVMQDFEHFKAVLKVWKWNNPTEKPTIRDFPSIISLATI